MSYDYTTILFFFIKYFNKKIGVLSEVAGVSIPIVFKPKARLLLQLGDQLIRNEKIAILELIKNSYDADAKNVTISMKNVENPKKGIIEIIDNGNGMNADIMRNVWMEPGTDFKEKLVSNKVYTKLGRLPIGEKGIGRFGVHKLGYEIELISKMEGFKEVYLKIDWRKFEKDEYLDSIKIELVERTPIIFQEGKTGTHIIIKSLRTNWTRGMVREVYRSIMALNSPFESLESFYIHFHIDKQEWVKNLTNFNDIKDQALYKVEAEINGDKITSFTYEFIPWTTMIKMDPKRISERSIKMLDEKDQKINLGEYRIGTVKINLYIYDRDKFVLSMWQKDISTLKEYLDENGGIRVYRDKIRVLDYGEPENDWLNLGARRVNIPSKRISNNLVVGAVHLNREKSKDLIEKTNREGFIENDAYYEFKKAVFCVVRQAENLRNIDKGRLRELYKQSSNKAEPIIDNLSELQDKISKSKIDEKLKEEFYVYIRRIEEDYQYINEVYLKSASAGLNLSIVIHEIEKIIQELNKVVEKEKAAYRIVKLAKRLADLVEGYSRIIKDNNESIINISQIIKQALFNIEFRLEAHKLEIVDGYSMIGEKTNIKCSSNLVISTIVNIIDNSIWWLNYAERKIKKLYIGVSDELPGYKTIIIADNGPGFTLPTDVIIKPFVTRKPSGMGIGLYLANEIMEAHKGKLLFPDKYDFSIPKEFKDGAIVALAFKGDEQ